MLNIAAIIPAPDNAEISATMASIKVRLEPEEDAEAAELSPHFEQRSQLWVKLSWRIRELMKDGMGGGGGKSGISRDISDIPDMIRCAKRTSLRGPEGRQES